MMKKEQEKQNLTIHYYFNDDSHAMDAIVRNAMERDFLNFISEIGKTLDIEFSIESQARKEGGLKETLMLTFSGVISAAMFFQPSINEIIAFYSTGENKMQDINLQIKKEKLRQEEIKTQSEFLKLQEQRKKLEENHKIEKHLSNFYRKATNYEKIKQIGYQFNENFRRKNCKER